MSQQSREVETVALVLARHLLLLQKDEDKTYWVDLDDVPYMKIYTYTHEFEKALKDCLRWGLFHTVKISLWSRIDDNNKFQLDKTMTFTSKHVSTLSEYDSLIPQEYRTTFSDDKTRSIEIGCNREQLKKYVEDYVADWINNRLYRAKTNIYKASKQLEIIARAILKLLKHYSPNKLLVTATGDEEVDFFATILFLEQRGYVRLLNIQETSKGEGLDRESVVGVRLDIEPRFFEEFSTATEAYPEDYLDYVIKQEDIENKRITYHYPDTLKFKGLEHQFNKDCLPYWLFYLAYNTQAYEVDISELVERAKNKTDDLEKGIKNLRDTLRKKFGFDEFESFISIEGSKVRIDKAKFYFKPKKV